MSFSRPPALITAIYVASRAADAHSPESLQQQPDCHNVTRLDYCNIILAEKQLVQTLSTGTQGTERPGTMLSQRTVHPSFDCSNRSALRSAARGDLVVPRTRLQLGNRAFCVAGPVVWNSLPLHIRSALTLSTFKTCSRHIFSLVPTSLTRLTVSRVTAAKNLTAPL